MICPREGHVCYCDIEKAGICFLNKATPPPDPRLSITADDFAAMARDAERYRWLRNYSFDQYKHPIVIEQRAPDDIPRYLGPLCGDLLDKKVDAAMAERNK